MLEKQNRVISEGIRRYNESFAGGQPQRFSIYAKNENNEIVAGATVYSFPTSVYVDVLWVDERHRGAGLGSMLLKQVEIEAVKNNIYESTLDTFSFQAEQFYIKQGYKPIGTIKNYLNGHDRIFLRKHLDPVNCSV
ncbi:GNAT family N-acetyltransferase [Legionella moravica]|uniref:GNAT family N-acetyltransferase n=1 Tax=Legionella moravica TaxID=39962 RepID=UPI001F5F4805|nr:GNAT family N-acetyltransferase [Legionella moravica]